MTAIRITYLAPADTDPPYVTGWDDSEEFVQFMIRGYLAPDPVTGERVVYDHGEYIVEEEGRRVYFHYADGRVHWEDEDPPPSTDRECPECMGSGLMYIKRNPNTGRPYKAWKIVAGQSCRKCGGTGRVMVEEAPDAPSN